MAVDKSRNYEEQLNAFRTMVLNFIQSLAQSRIKGVFDESKYSDDEPTESIGFLHSPSPITLKIGWEVDSIIKSSQFLYNNGRKHESLNILFALFQELEDADEDRKFENVFKILNAINEFDAKENASKVSNAGYVVSKPTGMLGYGNGTALI